MNMYQRKVQWREQLKSNELEVSNPNLAYCLYKKKYIHIVLTHNSLGISWLCSYYFILVTVLILVTSLTGWCHVVIAFSTDNQYHYLLNTQILFTILFPYSSRSIVDEHTEWLWHPGLVTWSNIFPKVGYKNR